MVPFVEINITNYAFICPLLITVMHHNSYLASFMVSKCVTLYLKRKVLLLCTGVVELEHDLVLTLVGDQLLFIA